MSEIKISAALNVHNEEANLKACLETLGFADEIVVILDNCTDGSKEIAQAFNAKMEEGAWEFEGERRNRAIALASGEWIFEIDADERVPAELADEILAKAGAGDADNYLIPVDTYVGARHVRYGWAGNFGKAAYVGLFRNGAKNWHRGRVHPGFDIAGKGGGTLSVAIIRHIGSGISDMLRRVDRCTTSRARDLAELGEVSGYAGTIRKSLGWFIRSYLTRRGYREGAMGLAVAICVGLHPLLSQFKAKLEVSNSAAGGGGP